MEINEFIKATALIPVNELTNIAADRRAFGDDVLAAFASQVQLRSTAAQTVLDAATTAGRDTLLASEQRSYDTAVRERDSVLSLQRAVEQRTEQRNYVPPTQAARREPRAGTFFGVELRALVGTTGAGGVVTPAEYGASFFDLLTPQSVVLKAGAKVIRTDRDTLIIPRIDTDPTSTTFGQGSEITASDPGYTGVTATPRKIGAMVRMANEVITDSSPDILSLLEMQMARSLALQMDMQFFEGSGTPPAIRGFKNVSSILTTSMGVAGAIPADLDKFATAIGKLLAANANPTAIFMHPRTWGTLCAIKELTTGSNKPLLQDSAGSGAAGIQRAIFGVPVYLSSQLSITEQEGASGSVASSAYVVDMSGIVACFRQDARLQLDSSRLFNTDESELKATVRVDLVVPNASVISRITGILAAA
jgi:HK97 family phage major capsid protein